MRQRSDWRQPEVQRAALAHQNARLLAELAEGLRKATQERGMSYADAWNAHLVEVRRPAPVERGSLLQPRKRSPTNSYPIDTAPVRRSTASAWRTAARWWSTTFWPRWSASASTSLSCTPSSSASPTSLPSTALSR